MPKIGRSGPRGGRERDEARRERYRANRDAGGTYSAWLDDDPNTRQSIHVSDHDARVVHIALGEHDSLEARALYCIAKHQKNPTVYDREWLAGKVARCNLDTVSGYLKLLADEGLIRYRAIRKKSPKHRHTGIYIELVPDNLAEQVAAEGAEDRDALRERDRKVDAIQELVDLMRTAAPGELPALMAALHAATGEDGASGLPEEDAPKAPEPAGGSAGDDGKDGGIAPRGHEGAEPKTADDIAPGEETAELPGYAELAKADRRADKVKPSYQRDAQRGYQALLADQMKPTPHEVTKAYEMYQKGLVEQGKTKMLRPLGRWLERDDEYGARAGVRALREERTKDGSGDSQEAPRADCPYCGLEMTHYAGYVYVCSNPECERQGRVNVLGREEECHVRPR